MIPPMDSFGDAGPDRELRNSTPGVWRIQTNFLSISKMKTMRPSREFRPTLAAQR
jgi:hypothetical protein